MIIARENPGVRITDEPGRVSSRGCTDGGPTANLNTAG
jgi:hypothetical protein